MNLFIKLASLFVLTCSLAFASLETEYARNGEELCNFIHVFAGGLNPASMMCASDAGANRYSPDESAFCHQLILEKRLKPLDCLSAISSQNIPVVKLQECAQFRASKEILACLNHP